MQLFSKPLFDTRGFSLAQLGAALAVLIVIGVSGGLMVRGLRGGGEEAPKSVQPTAVSNGKTIKQEVTARPDDFAAAATVPEGYSLYADNMYGFSFAYPSAWGSLALDPATGDGALVTGDVTKIGSDTHGQLRVQMFDKSSMYRPVPYKAGPRLRPQPLSGKITWQIVEVSKAYGGYVLADDFPAKAVRVVPVVGQDFETVTIYEFTTTQGKATSTVWIFTTSAGFVQITMPELSEAYDYDNHPIPGDKEGYDALKKQILQSIQISSLLQ